MNNQHRYPQKKDDKYYDNKANKNVLYGSFGSHCTLGTVPCNKHVIFPYLNLFSVWRILYVPVCINLAYVSRIYFSLLAKSTLELIQSPSVAYFKKSGIAPPGLLHDFGLETLP